MGDRYSENYDLPHLLRSGDLDIWGIVANNRELLTGEYFCLLSDFLNQSPGILAALTRIGSLNGDRETLKSLAGANGLLESVGCYKCISAFDDIIDAAKKGDKKLAADRAKRVFDDFNRLFAWIQAAKKTAKPKNELNNPKGGSSGHEDSIMPYGTYPLKKILELLDHEEATRKMRILAVDDAPVMLKIITSVLSDDYKVYGMTNPTMVEKFLQQITPELFLLDYMMPERNGFDLVPIIRSFEEHRNTPIIFLTSLGTIDHISAAVALGACDFVVKPFQAEILREKIAKHIVRKRLL